LIAGGRASVPLPRGHAPATLFKPLGGIADATLRLAAPPD
jgi:hypothetical protein